jgi:carbon-monoxide dehydrogenase large subunit
VTLQALAAAPSPLEVLHSFECSVKTTSFSVHVVIVAVDVATGRVRPLRYWLVSDVGRAINPVIVEAQLIGGLAQGLGGGLGEELVYDDAGQLLTATLMDYPLLAAADCPAFDVRILEESPSPSNPLGVKGVGETGTIASPAAVMNAVVDALQPFGVEDIQMPAIPERVWRAIEAGRA